MAIPERRKVQRIRFSEPLEGRVRGRRVDILDLSTDGMSIQQPMAVKSGAAVDVEIDWNGETIRAAASVTRCTLSHYTEGPKSVPVHHSGLLFTTIEEADAKRLLALLEHFLRRSLDEGRDLGGGKLPSDIGQMPLEVWLRNKLK